MNPLVAAAFSLPRPDLGGGVFSSPVLAESARGSERSESATRTAQSRNLSCTGALNFQLLTFDLELFPSSLFNAVARGSSATAPNFRNFAARLR